MNGWYLILFWRLILQMPAATLRIFWLKVKIEFRGLVSTWYFLFLRPTYYKPGQMEILWKWKKIYALCHKFVTFGLHIILSVTVMKINCSLNLKTLSPPLPLWRALYMLGLICCRNCETQSPYDKTFFLFARKLKRSWWMIRQSEYVRLIRQFISLAHVCFAS